MTNDFRNDADRPLSAFFDRLLYGLVDRLNKGIKSCKAFRRESEENLNCEKAYRVLIIQYGGTISLLCSPRSQFS